MRYQIICTTRKDDNSIDKLGYFQAGYYPKEYKYLDDKEAINKKIDSGDGFYFTNKGGVEVEVISVEDEHVRTIPDGTKDNNLLHLKLCQI